MEKGLSSSAINKLSKNSPTSMDVGTFLKATAILNAHFPRLELTKDRLTAMYHFLKDIPRERLIVGLRKFCMRHREIYPQTNIIAYIREYSLIDDDEITAMEAWEMVLGYIRNGRAMPEIVERAANAVGMREIRMSETPGVERAHFIRAYEAMAARERNKRISGDFQSGGMNETAEDIKGVEGRPLAAF